MSDVGDLLGPGNPFIPNTDIRYHNDVEKRESSYNFLGAHTYRKSRVAGFGNEASGF
jgi:hypothetical protein